MTTETAQRLFDDAARAEAMRRSFLAWQCRLRQMMMRDGDGRPDDGVMPTVTLEGATEPLGHVITVMSKIGPASKTMEFRHMARRTHDPAEKRKAALTLLSETYFQKPDEFSDTLTAVFAPASPGADQLTAAGGATLDFERYSQRYALACSVRPLGEDDPLYQATYWLCALFNPSLGAGARILGFKPDWTRVVASPAPNGLVGAR